MESTLEKEIQEHPTKTKDWKEYQKILFRIGFVFMLALCIPSKPEWYTHLFRIDWTNLHCRDLYDIASFSPQFVKLKEGDAWYLAGYLSWFILLVASVLIGLVWTFLDRKRKNYNVLYFWIRALVRYRAALGIIGFSFEKIFPTQMPYPSYANLATNFGDFTGHKIFWQLIGISPWYQVFGGLIELVPGILLLFRKTAALGAALMVGALLTIAFANLGYDGGVHVYASYFVVLGVFLLLKDIPAIYRLLVLEKPAQTFRDTALDHKPWLKYASVGLKVAFGIYSIAFAWLFYLNFRYDPYKQPSTAGVKTLRGHYDVAEFRINNKVIPYSPLDTIRWQEATFEDWTTLTFKTNKKVRLELSNSGGGTSSSGTGHSSVDLEKAHEIAGVSGGRQAFHYFADTVNKVLYLQEKNLTRSKLNKKDPYPKDWISAEAQKNIGDDNHKINKKAWSTRRDRDFAKMNKELIRDKFILKYQTDNGDKIILTGTNEKRDSIYVVLNRIDRKFTLPRGSFEAGSY